MLSVKIHLVWYLDHQGVYTDIHILVTLIIIVAGIVLVVFLYILNFTVTSGTINGIICYANIISINDSVFLKNNNVF